MTNYILEQIQSEKLRKVVEMGPIISELLQKENILIGIVDMEQYLYYAPGTTLDAQVKVGDPFYEHDLFGQVIKNRERTVIKTPPEYGAPFKGVGIPIFDEGELVGCIGIGISLDQEYEFLDIINNLESISDVVQDKAHTMLAQTEQLSATTREIATYADNVEKNSSEIHEVTQIINNIAEQSNLLGLNASIEAARAGEHGRTFSVVADEIRKMASGSAEGSQKINEVIKDTLNNIQKTSEQLSELAQAVDTQEMDAETFSSTTEELNQITNSLKRHIEVLTNDVNE
ncbi:methyl-accepting chemotaxis protein [Gracilibacillus sp. S3-1-1]|uniref:Methyl-accepting chemotaxis protein n=1 Tax=Gracilibacillus pellucidus TaxID=3095368 RepID=A0ACC6M106_9BACI|nr:methyl-accepting chemotaxis protein [Gracilibacillus sp. S3-1-1]MDX8044624.1 methyl-accepting chemotaxis protein [Gracilibacillus sp. S3-1-1]